MSRLYSIQHGQPWPPPSSHRMGNKAYRHKDREHTPPRSHTPSLVDATLDNSVNVQFDGDNAEEERMKAAFKEAYRRSEAQIASLFEVGNTGRRDSTIKKPARIEQSVGVHVTTEPAKEPSAPKKAARTIDEDNYDDDEEDEDEDAQATPLKPRATNAPMSPSKSGSSPVQSDRSPIKPAEPGKDDDQPNQPKSSEVARKQLEESKKATEEAAKRSFHTLFYTLENDRVAMLEQRKLEESEKQLNAEMGNGASDDRDIGANADRGSLSSSNLGASSIKLKHLLASVDKKRDRIKSSDAELRTLISEVRKNRSKWANEDNVNQEDLYDSCDNVLGELKGMTEYSTPFLTRVNKREAPDYHIIIKHPMDFGTMTKKLKNLQYKSRAEFVADLDLIWNNCLKYNADVNNPFRKKANAMRKEAEKLIGLIPDLVVRPRAEVEAEERRKQNGGDDDGADDSDDEPIMSSRGRKTATKGASKTRKAITGRQEETPAVEQKPVLQINGILGNAASDGSDAAFDGSQNGLSTPPVGTIGSVTPAGGHGPSSQSDAMDIDGPSMNGLTLGAAAEDRQESEEYKIWKQVTKKDRALVAKERNRLFKGDKLNLDEPALLRSKAGMRRWLRQKKQALDDGSPLDPAGKGKDTTQSAETLAEGMEGEEERCLPDYYDLMSAIPEIEPRLQWNEDAEGNLIDQSEDNLRMVPAGHFTAPKSKLSARIEVNMKQMQETRKLCSKIGVIKQMQLQAQMYNNQFPKYEPEPFLEADIEPHVTSDNGPIMAPWACRAAMQRSVAKICYHAGFEELQPSALDVIADMAGDYFGKLARTFNVYREAPKVPAPAGSGRKYQARFTNEEVVLHSLNENGLDIESLESYVKDDVDRLGTKLVVMHDRMKAHLADLLRPALNDAGADGSGAFNDGSEQFVGGDFAEELGEDFFGFRALGLDAEFGMASLAVPLHLLQTRLHNTYTGPAVVAQNNEIFPPLPPLPPVTKENIQTQIGLVKNFFLAKLHANDDKPLIEDEDLTGKQKPTRPRLGPTGKITTPRKRPFSSQTPGNAKKKKKLDNGMGMDPATGAKTGGNSVSPEKVKKLKNPLLNGNGNSGGMVNGTAMERVESSTGNASQTEKDDGSAVGMMSPESIER